MSGENHDVATLNKNSSVVLGSVKTLIDTEVCVVEKEKYMTLKKYTSILIHVSKKVKLRV